MRSTGSLNTSGSRRFARGSIRFHHPQKPRWVHRGAATPTVRAMPEAPPGLYFHHPASLEHDPRAHMPGHPDTPERLITLEHTLAADEWLGWERRLAPA